MKKIANTSEISSNIAGLISNCLKFNGDFNKWWRQTESNRRHKDFQSFALPTELWSHSIKGVLLV